jgi:inorganic pyrophosphatase
MKLQIGDKAPEQVNVFIEIPKDSSIKYELDKETGVVMVDRFLYTAMAYPFNYGFVPETLAEDGDPIDIMVLTDKTLAPGVMIPAKIIGMLEMEDEAGIDTKIVAVPPVKIDPFFGVYEDVHDIPEALKNKMKHFYENYKTLEPGKWVKLKDWKAKETAVEAVTKSMEAYKK